MIEMLPGLSDKLAVARAEAGMQTETSTGVEASIQTDLSLSIPSSNVQFSPVCWMPAFVGMWGVMEHEVQVHMECEAVSSAIEVRSQGEMDCINGSTVLKGDIITGIDTLEVVSARSVTRGIALLLSSVFSLV